MPDLKLGKLPDRDPVKISITLQPDLARELSHYAQAYRAAYGQAEPVAELIPFMLDAFLKTDRSYAKTPRPEEATPSVDLLATRKRRKRGDSSPSTSEET